MKYLLDTCIVSELVNPSPAPSVIEWIQSHDELDYALSVLTIGELAKEIAKLPKSKKRDSLWIWLTEELRLRFAGRILSITEEIIMVWGDVCAQAEIKGKKMPAIDSLIASTALTYDLVVVTRNTKDLKASGVKLLDPWDL